MLLLRSTSICLKWSHKNNLTYYLSYLPENILICGDWCSYKQELLLAFDQSMDWGRTTNFWLPWKSSKSQLILLKEFLVIAEHPSYYIGSPCNCACILKTCLPILSNIFWFLSSFLLGVMNKLPETF